MRKTNKMAILLLALISTLSFGIFAACSDKPNDSSSSSGSSESSSEGSSSSSSSENSSSSSSGETENVQWTDWEFVSAPDCTTEGQKKRTAKDDPSKVQYAPIAPRGHAYAWDSNSIELAGDLGFCSRCHAAAEIPALPADQEFPFTDYNADNGDYNRMELSVGCYTMEIPSSGKLWLSFSVPQAGQYVLYSVGTTTTEVTRYNASEHYVPATGIAGKVKNDNFYSYVNCGEGYFSQGWRATYCVKGDAGTSVKFCFTQYAPVAWEPQSVRTFVYAEEIVEGQKAEDVTDEGLKLLDVNYNAPYFYNSTTGYYHLGTQANPGPVIYAALNTTAPRLFGDGSFKKAVEELGSALNLQDGLTADGDFNIRVYIPFLLNCADDNDPNNKKVDLDKLCYQNYCNSDGLHPVNKEIFKFLNIYVANKPPVGVNIGEVDADRLWLAACYYYDYGKVGTQDNPQVFFEGENEAKLPFADFLHAKLTTQGVYTLTFSEAIDLQLGEENLFGITTLTVQAPISFLLSDSQGEAKTITVTLEKTLGSSNGLGGEEDASPIETKTGALTLKTLTVYGLSGTEATLSYYAFYAYTPTQAGTLTFELTGETDAAITFAGNPVTATTGAVSVTVQPAPTQDGAQPAAEEGEDANGGHNVVTVGETVIIHVLANEETTISATLTFTPAQAE